MDELNSKPVNGEPPSEIENAQAIKKELSDFVRTHEQRRRQLPRALLVGVIAGLIAVAFRGVLQLADRFRDQLIDYGHTHPAWGVLIPMLYGATGAGLAVFLVRRFAPEASGSGIPHLKAVLHRLSGMKWERILPVKFVGGVLGIGAGMALGREGPMVQMGGAVGQMVGRWLNVTPRERQTLIAAGAGAGLAAAFNAPLAGLIFVLEEVQRDFSPNVFTAAFIASATADVVSRSMLGQLPVFHASLQAVPSLSALPLFVVLGVVAGTMGVVFNRCLLGSLNLFQRARGWPIGSTGAIVGLGVGLIGWRWPETLGGGHGLVEQTLSAKTALEALPFLFILRFCLTMFSYGCGAPGGIFAPLLVLGAQIGLAVGEISQRFFPKLVTHPEAFAIVGMSAYFIGIVRAPLTGVVLILEMTGNYNLLLPLLVAGICAYGIADFLGDEPIYEALLERDLLRGEENPELEDTLLLELPVLSSTLGS